jgi:hypothetical protein
METSITQTTDPIAIVFLQCYSNIRRSLTQQFLEINYTGSKYRAFCGKAAEEIYTAPLL